MGHMLALLLLGVVPWHQAPAVIVDLVDPAPVARHGAVLASVPFARGELKLPAGAVARTTELAVTVTVAGREATPSAAVSAATSASGLTLMQWPDGSVALLQVAIAVPIAARSTARVVVVPVVRDGVAVPFVARGPAAPVPALLSAPPLWTELLDPWGRVFRADLEPDLTAGPGGVLADVGQFCVRRYRSSHRAVGGDAAGRPWLDLRAYLLTFAGERRAELTLVLDNQEPLAGPVGPSRFLGFRLCTGDDALRFLPEFAGENLLPPPAPRVGGGHVQWLLAPAVDHYLGDGTAKVVRLHLFADGAEVDDAAREVAAWAPLRSVGFADLEQVRRARAFGGLGGPAPRRDGDLGSAGRQIDLWSRGLFAGPYSGFGDPEDAAAAGTVRQGDSLLHNVLRWRSSELLSVAEGMVLQHGLRPTGGRAARLPPDTAAYRAGLPPLAIAAPHGFPPIDYEHCSVHLLFDYYWLTGDAWARDELARVGRSIRAMLTAVPFRTARGEGCCLAAGAACARATGDRALLEWLVEHAVTRIAPSLAPAGSPVALAQPPHPAILGGDTRFDAPAQMALLIRGLAALHAATDDARLLPLVARVADAMAGSAWLEGEGPKTFVSSDDAGRYSMAASPEDRSGQDRMVIGALVLAAELADDPAAAARLHGRAEFLFDRELPVDAGLPERLRAAANPWLQVALDRRRTP